MRNDQLMRQWRLLRRLEASPRGVALRRMAGDEKVHLRTIKRDVLALAAAGIPVHEHRVAGERRWRLPEGYGRLLSFPIAPSELMALALARPQLQPLEGTDLARAMDDLLERVRVTLAPETRAFLRRLEQAVIGEPPHASYGDLPGQLLRAIAERRTVDITYRSAWRGANTRRKLDPYAIRLHAGTLYVVGHDHLRKAVRLFAVERVLELSVTADRFADPAFDAASYFAGPLDVMREGQPYDVRLWVAAEAAFFIEERPWHPSQKTKNRGDGSLDVTMRIDGLREIAWKVLSYGSRVRALAPGELVNLVRSELHEALAGYETGEVLTRPDRRRTRR